MEKLLALIFVYIFVENFVLMRFFGICPFLGVSRKMETAVGMSMAVIFVMTISTLVTWLLYTYLLEPFNLLYLQIVAFILVIASLVQLVETVLRKISPTLYQGLGIYLPLITTNCAVLGVALLNVEQKFSLFKSLLYGFGSALGFTIVLLIFAGLRERIALARVPAAFAGAPISFVTISLLALAFMGFSGLNV